MAEEYLLEVDHPWEYKFLVKMPEDIVAKTDEMKMGASEHVSSADWVRILWGRLGKNITGKVGN